MSRVVRNYIAAMAQGVFVASFGTFILLVFFYTSLSRPKVPQPELGIVHRLNQHGFYGYLSDAESTGLSLLAMVCFASFLLAFAIVPKKFDLPPPETPRWLMYVGGTARFDLGNVSPQLLKAVFLCSLILSLGLIFLWGHAIADFPVSKGIILQYF